MADKRDLSEIRPARGVKIKPRKRKPIQGEAKEVRKPRVIQGVQVKDPNEQIPPPTEDSIRLLARINESKQKLIGSMKAFNKLLRVKTLPENKSEKEKNIEQSVVGDLIAAAIGVENLNQGDGVMGVCIFAVRQALSLRDAGNTLAFEVQKLKERIDQIEEDVYEEETDTE